MSLHTNLHAPRKALSGRIQRGHKRGYYLCVNIKPPRHRFGLSLCLGLAIKKWKRTKYNVHSNNIQYSTRTNNWRDSRLACTIFFIMIRDILNLERSIKKTLRVISIVLVVFGAIAVFDLPLAFENPGLVPKRQR